MNMVMIDLHSKTNSNLLFHHQSYQMWEQTVRTKLLKGNSDLLVINKNGVSVMHLGTLDKKYLTDSNEREIMLHSLEGYSFLKADPCNYLKFNCLDEDNQRICIMQEFSSIDEGTKDNNEYTQIY